MRHAIGLDLGGTNIKGAVVDERGRIVVRGEVSTGSDRGHAAVLDSMGSLVEDLAGRAGLGLGGLAGVGMGLAGFIDESTGVVVEAVNLGWRNVAVKGPLETRLGLPVHLDNDANVAALGESWAGAGAGHRSALCITLGTGVGGGIVLDGRIWRGANMMAGEIGHIVVNPGGARCNCGLYGCLETIGSATGVVRLMKERLAVGAVSQLSAEGLTAADVFAAAKAGDATAGAVTAEAAEALGRGFAIAANLINPDVIIVGGGMARAGEFLLELIRKAFAQYALPRVLEAAEIVPATLGNDAGVVGAAKLALYS